MESTQFRILVSNNYRNLRETSADISSCFVWIADEEKYETGETGNPADGAKSEIILARDSVRNESGASLLAIAQHLMMGRITP